MLAISHGAAEVIKQLVSSGQMPDEGGIRISGEPLDDDNMRLDLSLAPSPEPSDAIVAQEGANVFVERTVAPFLEDKTLDAAVQADKVTFSLVEQGQGQDWSGNGQPKNFDPRNLS